MRRQLETTDFSAYFHHDLIADSLITYLSGTHPLMALGRGVRSSAMSALREVDREFLDEDWNAEAAPKAVVRRARENFILPVFASLFVGCFRVCVRLRSPSKGVASENERRTTKIEDRRVIDVARMTHCTLSMSSSSHSHHTPPRAG